MRRLAPTEEAGRLALQSVPPGRLAIKDVIADLALFLCTDAAAYITGARQQLRIPELRSAALIPCVSIARPEKRVDKVNSLIDRPLNRFYVGR